MGLRHVSNADGTVTQFDEDSGQELVTFPDPDGSFTRDHVEPAAASAATPAPGGSNAERTFAQAMALSPARQTVTPEQGITVSPEAPATGFQSALTTPAQPSQAPDTGTGIKPAALPVAGQETSGLAADDRATREGMRQEVVGAETKAAESQTAAEQATADAREARVQAENDRALGRYATDLQLHELAKQKVLEAEDFAKKARATPIEPGQALAGNKFFYAIMAGVGASLSNFGAALLGQRGTADANLVDDIVNDSVQQQIADRKLNVEGAQDSLDASRRDELQLRIQANASLEKWFDSRAQVERSPEVRAALSSHADERRAAVAKDSMALAENNWSHSVQKQAAPKPVAAGPAQPLLNAETQEDMAALKANGTTQERLTKYQTERAKTGADSTLQHVGDMRELVKALTGKGTDIPGIGPIDSATQALLRSNDASKVQQARGFLVSAFVKSRSGASVTDKERSYLDNIIQGTGSNQVESLENGLQGLESEARTALQALDRGNPSEARAYEQIGANQKRRSKLSEKDSGALARQRAAAAKPAEPAAPEAPEPASDPVRRVKQVGFSRALNEFLTPDSDGSQAPGSPL